MSEATTPGTGATPSTEKKETLEDLSIQVAMNVTRHYFKKRGNYSEIHLSPTELATMIAAALVYWEKFKLNNEDARRIVKEEAANA